MCPVSLIPFSSGVSFGSLEVRGFGVSVHLLLEYSHSVYRTQSRVMSRWTRRLKVDYFTPGLLLTGVSPQDSHFRLLSFSEGDTDRGTVEDWTERV